MTDTDFSWVPAIDPPLELRKRRPLTAPPEAADASNIEDALNRIVTDAIRRFKDGER